MRASRHQRAGSRVKPRNTKVGCHAGFSADVYFDQDECQVLIAYEAKYGKRPADAPAPTLREAIRMVAKLGGFIGRKSDGEPGTETLWRGLLCLDGMTMGWRLASGP